jgi:hypothetical protein
MVGLVDAAHAVDGDILDEEIVLDEQLRSFRDDSFRRLGGLGCLSDQFRHGVPPEEVTGITGICSTECHIMHVMVCYD